MPRRGRQRARDPEWERDRIPDVRDGLTRIERVVLWQISELQKERGGRDAPTAMLYGRVVEHVDISVDELQAVLQRLIGVRHGA
ncbi:MAG: hypothetical protein M3Y87_18095 [Myxococcota bacterium]|nr:hypothetical protein [Myxococcota bacterium]